jgi:hypothetical protein
MSATKTFFSLITCIYLAAIAAQTFPSATLIHDRLFQLTRAPVEVTGLWQHWKMFAPEPLRMNIYLDAEVTYRDGTKTTWTFPRSEEMGLSQRYLNERWDQWKNYIRGDSHKALWKDAASYIARRTLKDPRNPPVSVSLARHWANVPAPPQEGFVPLRQEMTYSSYTFFKTPIEAADLEAKGRE